MSDSEVQRAWLVVVLEPIDWMLDRMPGARVFGTLEAGRYVSPLVCRWTLVM